MPKRRQHAVVDALRLPDKSQIGSVARQFAGTDQAAILAAQAYRATADSVDRGDELLVDRAGENHLDDFHRLAVGNPQSVHKSAFDAEALQHLADLRPTAMHDDRIDPDLLQQNDVAGERIAILAIPHRMPAVFDEDRLAGITAQIGQRLGEDSGFQCGVGDSRVHHGGRILSCPAARRHRARRNIAARPKG